MLGPKKGKLQDLIVEGTGEAKEVKGLKTVDGTEHYADVTIVACGGWTPSVVPEVEGILETTAGSVITIQLPKDRGDLWSKVKRVLFGPLSIRQSLVFQIELTYLRPQFSPDNFPVWSYGITGHNSPEHGGKRVVVIVYTPRPKLKDCFRDLWIPQDS